MSRGGKRQGAGRKAQDGVPRVTLNARVHPDTLRVIRERKGEKSVGQYIDELVKKQA